MSDLISRQAAIEVLRNRWLKTRNYEGIGEDIAEECEIYLKTLPSAQLPVEAIPVEWMINEWDSKEYADVGYQVMRRIIADWAERKEE